MKSMNRGSALVIVMMVITVLAVGVGAALEYTRNIARNVQRTNALQQAVAAGNGALDLAFLQWRSACRASENTPLTASNIAPSLSTAAFPDLSGTGKGIYLVNLNPVTVSITALNATDPTMTPLANSAAPVPSQCQSATMPTYNYLATASVAYSTLTGTSTVSVCRVFQKVTSSPWQYAIFFNNDLEINPGAAFNVTGWVQTNGNLYTGGNGDSKSPANYLNFSSKATFAGAWKSSGQFAPTDTAHTGTPVAPTWSLTPPTLGAQQLPQNAAILTGSDITGNPNLADGYREIIERPITSSTDPLASTDSSQPSERYYNQAGVIILVTTGSTSANTTVRIMNKSGALVSNTSTGTDRALYNTFPNALTTNGSLKDDREGSTLTITTLDISKIQSALTTGGALAGTGANIIYITDTTANNGMNLNGGANPGGAANRGIELTNGYQMPAGGLTVVSDNPVYVRGDYNTAVKSTDTVPSNKTSGNDPTTPYASGYTPQPCSIMADAITILSNAWIDTSSTNGLSSRVASNTTVNAAILSGNVLSGSGFTYSGGAENFPRFLEDWGKNSATFTYYGSMVQLFQSKQAIGIWKTTGNYYNAPKRQWYFDTRFYTNPPPGTFKVISYVKSRWFTN